MTFDFGMQWRHDQEAKMDSQRKMLRQDYESARDHDAAMRDNQRRAELSKKAASITGYRSDGAPIYGE